MSSASTTSIEQKRVAASISDVLSKVVSSNFNPKLKRSDDRTASNIASLETSRSFKADSQALESFVPHEVNAMCRRRMPRGILGSVLDEEPMVGQSYFAPCQPSNTT